MNTADSLLVALIFLLNDWVTDGNPRSWRNSKYNKKFDNWPNFIQQFQGNSIFPTCFECSNLEFFLDSILAWDQQIHPPLSTDTDQPLFQTGMRSYLVNGVATPPPGSGLAPRHHRPGLMSGRASSSSLPRSPEQDTSLGTSLLTSGLGTGSVSGQSGHGSLGSHSSHEVSYMNIYQNTNHHNNIYVSLGTEPQSILMQLEIFGNFIANNVVRLSDLANSSNNWVMPDWLSLCCRTPTLKALPGTPWAPTTAPTWARRPAPPGRWAPPPTSPSEESESLYHQIVFLWPT